MKTERILLVLSSGTIDIEVQSTSEGIHFALFEGGICVNDWPLDTLISRMQEDE